MENNILEEIKKDIGRECCKIALTATDYTIDTDETELTQSKVLGDPFFPESMADEYPRTEAGIPLVMFVQINFAEVPHIDGLPTSGLLQVYLNPFDWNDENQTVLFFDEEQLKEESIDVYDEVLRGWLEDADYYMPTQHVHTMKFEKSLSYSAAEDKEYARQLSKAGKKYPKEAIDEYVKTHSPEFGSRIGGYCDFTRYDPRRYKVVPLLQLASEEGINFYDCGIMHVLIRPAALKEGLDEYATVYTDFY